VVAIEWVSWVPLLIFVVALGIFPKIIFGVTDAPVNALTHLFGG
jgi:NADH:ubiquinone oxidoreductase subunit 4 (subunit M)